MSALVISHRAEQGSMPENTLAGIEAAIAAGADAIEVDVRTTWDGVPVLMHDASLKRTTGDGRALGLTTLEELRAVRIRDPRGGESQPVPTLAEALACARGCAALVLDICEREIEVPVAAVVRAAGTGPRTWVTTHHLAEAQRFASLLPGARVLLSVGRRSGALAPLEAVRAAASRGLDGINPDYRLIDADVVDAAHARGLWVSTWTVDEMPDIERVLRVGVDSLCGNHTARLVEARARRGGRTPKRPPTT